MKNKKIAIIAICLIVVITVVTGIIITSKSKSEITTETSSNSNTDSRTMKEFVKKFEEEGYEIDLSNKPLYNMIGASDGIMFDVDNEVVKIYKYSSEKSYKEATKDDDIVASWDKNGLFILETESEVAKEIFKKIGTEQSKEESNENKKVDEKKDKEITLNETVTEKDWEIIVTETGFKQDILPSNPNSFYTHYQVNDTNNTYFYVTLDAKNISSLELVADKVAKIKMKYDNKYEYSTFSTIEESGGGTFTYANITNIAPLTTRKLYYLVEVPNTIADDGKPVEAQITINNNTYKLKIR